MKKTNRLIVLEVILCILLLSFFASCKKKEVILLAEGKETNTEGHSDISSSEENKKPGKSMCVHVCGAVSKPGVYILEKESRVIDAIKKAGGFTDNACEDYVNLAKSVEDEEKIYIPTVEEAEKISLTSDSGEKKININLATEEELKTLPGVGDSKAASIIEYRGKHGRFKRIEDIMKISGIKESMFQKIKDRISVD